MTLAEFCHVTPHIFFQIVQNILVKINFGFQHFNENKRYFEGSMLGPATIKIIHHRGNLEIREYPKNILKYPKTKH